MKPKRLIVIVIAVAPLSMLGWEIGFYWKLRDQLHAKKTEARMVQLIGILDAEQPKLLDAKSLEPLLAKYNRSECLKDGWGRFFVIEHGRNGRSYTVISLGRSGRRGPCCTRFASSWDDNAVLAGQDWLQIWPPRLDRAGTGHDGGK